MIGGWLVEANLLALHVRLAGVRASSPLRVSPLQGSGAIKNLATRNRTRDQLMAAAFYYGVLYQLSCSRSVG